MNSINYIREAEKIIDNRFKEIEEIAYNNQEKVINAFKKFAVRDFHFNTSTGYGYSDIGRDVLENIYAEIFGGEEAIVRSQIVSGTHAIAACLFGILQYGDELISIVGSPYDTLGKVIGKNENKTGTLIEKGMNYEEIPLSKKGFPNVNEISKKISNKTKMVLIQRSRGYSLRPALSVKVIKELIDVVKKANKNTIVLVDNCYGEFVENTEPCEVGADIVAGSLIKNPGGGLVPSGGYIVGKSELIERIAYHLTAPGLGKDLGASLINTRILYQGLFQAPHVVSQALKGAILLAYLFEKLGYEVSPNWIEKRSDIVQTIKLKDESEVLKFCQVIQSNSPVDSDVMLEYAELPGYQDKVVMSAGTFIQGSSIELSCDAPLREPYVAYLQGGLTYEHCRYVVKNLLDLVPGTKS